MKFKTYLIEIDLEKINDEIRSLAAAIDAETKRMQRMEIEISPKLIELEDKLEALRSERQELLKSKI